jgi:rhombotail lipoprotein
MDHLLLVGGTIDQVTKENGLSLLDLTIVGAFVVPSKQVDAEARASGALIDIASGRVTLVASADTSRGRLASSATQYSGEIDVLREARDEVLDKLAAEVIAQCEQQAGAKPAARAM